MRTTTRRMLDQPRSPEYTRHDKQEA